MENDLNEHLEVLNKLVKIARTTPVIERMWVFGSRFKGEHRPDSDLDIAVQVKWVKNQGLGVGSSDFDLWPAAKRCFEGAMEAACPWPLDLQMYAGEESTPQIHEYLETCSRLLYEKTDA